MVCNIIELGGVINNNFTRNKFCKISEYKNQMKQFDSDIYRTIYSYDSTDINKCNFIAPMYLDLDIDNIEDNYDKLIRDLKIIIYRLKTDLKLSNNEINIYFSGAKGFHIIVDAKVFGFQPSRILNKELKKIALYYKAATFTKCIDTSIYDYRRLLRIPNTINSKTGLYKVIVPYDKLINMSFNELKQYASKPHDIIKKPVKYNKLAAEAFAELISKLDEQEKRTINTRVAQEFLKQKKLLPCVQYLLQNGAPNGQRNNSTVALANALFQIGHSLEEVTEIIEVWNSTKNEEPLSLSEIHATINSAYSNTKNNIFYGCSAFKELDICVKNCPIHK